jgi:N-acetylneuraminate synthase
MTDVVAEIGMAHDGSLNLAHAYIDAVAKAGVQWVKFQCHHPSEGTLDEPWRKEWSWYYGETRATYWRRTAFTMPQWKELKDHANQLGLKFACSVFCPAAVRKMQGITEAWKIPSGQVVNKALMNAIHARLLSPVWVSTGMADIVDIEGWKPDVKLHCVSEYPTAWNRSGWDRLQLMKLWRPWGLSDHSGTIWPSLQAAVEGAELVEVHVTFDKRTGLPDATSSLDMTELAQLVEGIAAMRTVRESKGWERPATAHLYEPSEVRPGVWKKTGSQLERSET